jgi:hypothetical protein
MSNVVVRVLFFSRHGFLFLFFDLSKISRKFIYSQFPQRHKHTKTRFFRFDTKK